MRLLLVTSVDPGPAASPRSTSGSRPGGNSATTSRSMAKQNAELPDLRFTTDLKNVDLALFVLQVPSDLPDMPYRARARLARRARSVRWSIYGAATMIPSGSITTSTIWKNWTAIRHGKWQDAIAAISDVILQPTLSPKRENVKPFLFHGFDEASVREKLRQRRGSRRGLGEEALWRDLCRQQLAALASGPRFSARLWSGSQRRRSRLPIGWDWSARPDWAAQMALMGVDTDPALLKNLDVEVRDGVRFDAIVGLLGQAKFAPVIHRPLFRELGFVTEPELRDFLRRYHSGLDTSARFRRADLRACGAEARSGKWRKRVGVGRAETSGSLSGMPC